MPFPLRFHGPYSFRPWAPYRDGAQTDINHIALAAGYYLICYHVSALFHTANYMQITPNYNGASHPETVIYFAATTNGSGACGSVSLILRAPAATEFSLFYSGSGDAADGQISRTILKSGQYKAVKCAKKRPGERFFTVCLVFWWR